MITIEVTRNRNREFFSVQVWNDNNGYSANYKYLNNTGRIGQIKEYKSEDCFAKDLYSAVNIIISLAKIKLYSLGVEKSEELPEKLWNKFFWSQQQTLNFEGE